jgi:Rod binding domain-containing protein
MADAASSLPLPGAGLPPARGADLAGRAANVRTRAEAEEVARKFETMFVTEMLRPMFDGIQTDGPFGGGSAEAAFRPMLIEKYGEQLTRQGGFGIADAVLKEILRIQGLE